MRHRRALYSIKYYKGHVYNEDKISEYIRIYILNKKPPS